jgi:threonine dehydratase
MADPTPLEAAPPSLAHGRRLYLKREDVHELGAFKWRGALPALQNLAAGAETVVTASTGNHGAAAAWAARRLEMKAVVYAPLGASSTKVALLENLGADLRLVGDDFDQAKAEARTFAHDEGLPFFEDGAEPAQFAGYGKIAEEILEQLEERPAAVVVPVGNGARLVGIGRVLGDRSPETLRVGVVPKEAPVMKLSFEAGGVVESDRCATFADGLAVRVAIPEAVEALRRAADRMLEVSERDMARAVAACDEAGIRAEGSAAAAFAAVPQLDDVGDPIVLIVTGRNIDEELLRRARESPESFPA